MKRFVESQEGLGNLCGVRGKPERLVPAHFRAAGELWPFQLCYVPWRRCAPELPSRPPLWPGVLPWVSAPHQHSPSCCIISHQKPGGWPEIRISLNKICYFLLPENEIQPELWSTLIYILQLSDSQPWLDIRVTWRTSENTKCQMTCPRIIISG